MRVRIGVVAVIVAVMALVLQSGASATGAIRIHEIYYNSPGSDDGSNPSLNAEPRLPLPLRLQALGGRLREDPHRPRVEHAEEPVLGKRLLHLEQRRRHRDLEAA